MIGPYINGSAVVIGGIIGSILGLAMPERLRTNMPLMFGAASMCMGVVLIVKVAQMPVMVLAIILGAMIGELIYLEKGIGFLGNKAKNLVEKVIPSSSQSSPEEQNTFLTQYVAILVLFCASGTGIFGSMNEGMTGDYTILVAKSFLDLFTAAIFATTLGYAVSLIAIPQLIIQLSLAYGATIIMPYITPDMKANFGAVGGIIMFATGFRICGIKSFAVANMLPALLIAMPITSLWLSIFG